MRKLVLLLLLLYIFSFTNTSAYNPNSGVEIDDIVLVDYTVSDVNGTNIDQRTNATFTINYQQLIRGFVDGMLGMKIGERKVFDVPPERGYTSGPLANQTLKFDVTLLDVLSFNTESTVNSSNTSSTADTNSTSPAELEQGDTSSVTQEPLGNELMVFTSLLVLFSTSIFQSLKRRKMTELRQK